MVVVVCLVVSGKGSRPHRFVLFLVAIPLQPKLLVLKILAQLYPKKKFTDFVAARQEISDETDRETGRSSKVISTVPIHLSIFSPNVVNLTLIDLPELTKVVVDGQPESIVQDIENMVRSFIEKPNCIILAISPANQDLVTSDAIKISRKFDPKGDRTFGVLTKIDLMDQGTNAVDVIREKLESVRQEGHNSDTKDSSSESCQDGNVFTIFNTS